MDEQEGYNNEYLIKELFGMSLNHFNEYVEEVKCGLLMGTDGFFTSLGFTLVEATTSQAIKLICCFRAECENHAWLYRIHCAKAKHPNCI